MINNLGSTDQPGLLKTEKQLLIEAEKRIGELEKTLRASQQENEKLKWQAAQLRIGVASLAESAGHTPEKVREIFDAYCQEQDKKYQQLAEEAKAKFVQDLKSGKCPDLRVVEGGQPGA